MSVQTDPLPPVPEQAAPLTEDQVSPTAGKLFSHAWTRWFTSLREKVNVLNESLANLANVSGTGILVKSGAAWIVRSIAGTSDRVSITNNDGAGGDPTVDVITSDLIAGPGIIFSGVGTDRIIGITPLTISATATFNGILPLVTGEISGDQPVFVYAPDGSLIYAPVN